MFVFCFFVALPHAKPPMTDSPAVKYNYPWILEA